MRESNTQDSYQYCTVEEIRGHSSMKKLKFIMLNTRRVGKYNLQRLHKISSRDEFQDQAQPSKNSCPGEFQLTPCKKKSEGRNPISTIGKGRTKSLMNTQLDLRKPKQKITDLDKVKATGFLAASLDPTKGTFLNIKYMILFKYIYFNPVHSIEFSTFIK